MAYKDKNQLANGEIEITWNDRRVERIQTQGMATQGMALVLDLGWSKTIIPWSSIKSCRVKSI